MFVWQVAGSDEISNSTYDLSNTEMIPDTEITEIIPKQNQEQVVSIAGCGLTASF